MIKHLASFAACGSFVLLCWIAATPDTQTPGSQYECAAGTSVYIDGPVIEVSDAMVDAACDTESALTSTNEPFRQVVCLDRQGMITNGDDWKECKVV